MNRVVVVCLIGCVVACSACGSRQHGSDPHDCPPAVENTVRTAEPGATLTSCQAEHKDGPDIYEVTVMRPDGHTAELELTPAGALIQIEETIDVSALPGAVAEAMMAKYPNAVTRRVERVTRADKSVELEITFDGGREVSFRENGDVIEDAAPKFVTSKIALPGGGPAGVGMDYLLYNPRTKTVWVPAGNTGAVDVIETATGKLARIEGFATQEMERNGMKRVVGPSSATLGAPGTVYVGSRGDFTVCAVDEVKLTRGTCGKLDAMPDGISFVSSTNEVWVTTPRDKSIRILDGKTLAQKERLAFDGEPEGFAPDLTRGRFYTNLEDKDVTLAIDLASHKTVATWKPSCGEDGPHGLRLVERDGFLIVACSTRVEVLDAGKGGTVLGSIETGDGLDEVDYADATRTVYAGAAHAASLTVAGLDTKGALTVLARVPTSDGARNGVVTPSGAVYLAHSKGSEIVVIAPESED